MAYNFADLFEHTVDTVPDRVGIACEGEHRTLAQLEEAGNRLAHHLIAKGVQSIRVSLTLLQHIPSVIRARVSGETHQNVHALLALPTPLSDGPPEAHH